MKGKIFNAQEVQAMLNGSKEKFEANPFCWVISIEVMK